MERVKVSSTQDELLLSGFRLILMDLARTDLEPLHRQYTEEIHHQMAQDLLDHGCLKEMIKIRDDVAIERRLVSLKHAFDDGEIAQ